MIYENCKKEIIIILNEIKEEILQQPADTEDLAVGMYVGVKIIDKKLENIK